ncbi:MAG TPA: sigma-70 family RNA polymerase sigma factor [Bacteroidales bacterium]|nr:sigma-70 family RNA polymerase sigma factor [Bacteroidales bacterium]
MEQIQIRDLTEDAIIKGCLENDRKEQERLYRKFADEMYNVCLVYEQDRDSAKDIMQDAFIKVFRNIDQYNRRGTLRGWIRRIVVNTALDHLRLKKGAERHVDIDAISETHMHLQFGVNHSDSKDILVAVNRLPEGARLVFNLFALEGFSHREIAERLNITEGTSKSQYSRARQLLQLWVEV